MFGKFHNLSVMVMKDMIGSSVRLQKCVRTMSSYKWKVDAGRYRVWGTHVPPMFQRVLLSP